MKTVVLVFLFLAVLTHTPSWAVQETKLTASNGATNDQFGKSVAISDNRVIVGAYNADGVGFNSGSAYVFDVSTGNELFKLVASDAASNDKFGWSTAISGTKTIVGARTADGIYVGKGAAYVFDVMTGNQLHKLTASDGANGDFFGYSVGISGDIAIVGAPDDNNESGSAYLFDATSGNELFKLRASDATAFDEFGVSVAISGNTAIVGAWRDDDGGNASGSAYLFNVTTGEELFKLTALDAATQETFGYSVGISGNIAIVGAFGDTEGGNTSGAAYLFDVNSGNQLMKLTASDAAAGDLFGWSVAISGNTAIIGSQFDDDGGSLSGSAYLVDVTTGKELLKLTASDAAEDDRLGYSVAIAGDNVIVAAWLDDDAGSKSGSAYLFTSIPEPNTSTQVLAATLFYLGRRRR